MLTWSGTSRWPGAEGSAKELEDALGHASAGPLLHDLKEVVATGKLGIITQRFLRGEPTAWAVALLLTIHRLVSLLEQ